MRRCLLKAPPLLQQGQKDLKGPCSRIITSEVIVTSSSIFITINQSQRLSLSRRKSSVHILLHLLDLDNSGQPSYTRNQSNDVI